MLTVEMVEEYIDDKLGEVYFLGKGIDVMLPEKPTPAVLQRVISEFSSAGWLCKGSGNTIYLTTTAALN